MRKTCLLLTVVFGLLLMPSAATALNFKPVEGSPIKVAPPDDVINAVTTGDFNSDIYDDVAAVGDSNKLYVWLTQPDGTFQPAPGSPYTTNTDSNVKTRIWARDVTSDFRDDLVIQSEKFPGTFYSLFNNGDGSFPVNPAGSWAVDWTPDPTFKGVTGWNSVTYADLTGDGCPDLLAGMYVRSYQVGISNCAGGFTRATSAPVPLTTPLEGDFDGFQQTDVGDYNGDGHADIALMLTPNTSGPGPRIVYVLYGNDTGLFGTPVAVYDKEGANNSSLMDIATIDQNGDSFDDLLVLTRNQNYSNTVTSLLGGAGGLVENPAGELSEPFRGAYGLTPADFDDDGAQDFGVSLRGFNQFNVALGDGLDSFAWDGPRDFAPIDGNNFSPNDLETPDLNGDGFPDIVSSSSHSGQAFQARGIHALISVPDVSADRSSIDFPETAVGQESAAQTVTLTAGSGPPAGFNNADFSIQGTGDVNYELETDCPGTLAGGETCEVNVTFAPSIDGLHDPDLKIKTPDGETITIPLSGVTGHEDLTVNTPEGTIWEIPGGSGDAVLTFEIEASGTWPVKVNEILVESEFEEDQDLWTVIDFNNCKTTLAPGQTCDFQVSFAPKLGNTGSSFNAYLVLISENDDLTSMYAELQGIATNSAYDVLPNQLEFGDRALGSGPSEVQEFTIEPTSDGAVPFYGVEAQGDDESSFEIIGAENCPEIIPVGSSCTIGVAFEPQGELGFKQTRIAIFAYNNNGGEYFVNVNGTAVSAEPPPPGPDADLRFKVQSARKVKRGKQLLVTATIRNAGNAASFPVTLKVTSPKKSTRPVKALRIPMVSIGETEVRRFRIPVKRNAKGKFLVTVIAREEGHPGIVAKTPKVTVQKPKKPKRR